MSYTATSAMLGDIETAAARAAMEQTLSRLLAQNGPALSRLASSFTNSASDRDDLLQEIAMAIWQALPAFRGECSERTFLFRIAHNRAVSFLARDLSRRHAADENIDVTDPGPDPEAGLLREQQGERLARAVHRLPILYRQVVMLILEGMDYGETAQILGITESNVGARLNRARQMLRKMIEGRK
jgi:RNA polymerase sigma factor (sigma-70 family)